MKIRFFPLLNFGWENLSKFEKFLKNPQIYFLKFCEKIFFNEIFCFLVIMSKKASADQFSVPGRNLGSNPTRKTDFCYGKDFFLGGSSYLYLDFGAHITQFRSTHQYCKTTKYEHQISTKKCVFCDELSSFFIKKTT